MNTPDNIAKTERNSNLELFRIVAMLLIVAHHYVVHSGVKEFYSENISAININTYVLFILGAWGKTGINCFLLITGWFMCKSNITKFKFIKLYLQIAFYAILIYLLFCIFGEEHFNIIEATLNFFPIDSISNHFISAFLVFYLLIPFINILVKNLTKKNMAYLIAILLMMYTILPTYPRFEVKFNYVSWFTCIYLIASYLRLYGTPIKITHRQWGYISLALIAISVLSVIVMIKMYAMGYLKGFGPIFFLYDSNQLLPLMIGISLFMYFKDLKIPHSKIINLIGGATFGVLLIHDNNLMRKFLWHDVFRNADHIYDSATTTLLYAISCILLVFIISSAIEIIRSRLIDPRLKRVCENNNPINDKISSKHI